MNQIHEALQKLDPANPDHWTLEGFPRVEALGIPGLKRADIVHAAPMFTRQNPTLEQDEDNIETEAGIISQKGSSGVTDLEMESSEFGGKPSEAPVPLPSPAERAAAQAELEDARAELTARQNEVERAAVARRDAEARLKRALDAVGGPTDGAENQRRIMSFLASTQPSKQEDAPTSKAPIDKAFERRLGYGHGRPNRIPRGMEN